jgi:ERCC4-type nuclease
MKVIIDERERELYEKCSSIVNAGGTYINLSKRVLPLGDIHITTDEDKDVLLIERKSLADLLASIKDGRYEEQSYRLNGLNHHNHNIIYLIEGDVNRVNRFKSDNKIEKLTLYSAMLSLNYYKGFSMFRSFSLEETATIICNMAYKLGKDPTKKAFYQNSIQSINQLGAGDDQSEESNKSEENIKLEENEVTEKDYVSVIKKVKKENITPDNIGEIMLCQIPGISSVTALAIMEKYKSLPNLIKEIENNNECLKDITSTNAKGQTRKINKTSLTNIVKFLLKK